MNVYSHIEAKGRRRHKTLASTLLILGSGGTRVCLERMRALACARIHPGPQYSSVNNVLLRVALSIMPYDALLLLDGY